MPFVLLYGMFFVPLQFGFPLSDLVPMRVYCLMNDTFYMFSSNVALKHTCCSAGIYVFKYTPR